MPSCRRTSTRTALNARRSRPLSSIDETESLTPRPFGNCVPCAKLVTTNKRGRRDVINLTLDMPVTIGRNIRQCTYVVQDKVVSNVHCKIYAVLSSTGGIIVSCQVLSSNGLIVNGHKLRRTGAIIMDGDRIEIPQSQSFKCIYIQKELRQKTHIFEPTPPQGSKYKNLTVGKYTVTSHCLGSGTFATVHLAVDSSAHKQVACKTIITKTRDKADIQKVMKEVTILRGLDHPNINRVLDVEVNDAEGWLHIFLELCIGGDLFTYITSPMHSDPRLCEGEAKFIMYQILKGLAYLHDKLISHRDLKPENIILQTAGVYPTVQIADFGLARTKAYQETQNVCGTVAYLPPEGILALDRKELGYVGMPSDCWSAGVILYTMLSGSHPFDYKEIGSDIWNTSDGISSRKSQLSQVSLISEQVIKSRIINGEIEFFDNIWGAIPDAKMLTARLLIHDHLHRETVFGALRSTWIVTDLEELAQAYEDRVASK